MIDVQKGELTLRVGNEAVHFNLNRSLEHPDVDVESCKAVENNSLLILATVGVSESTKFIS